MGKIKLKHQELTSSLQLRYTAELHSVKDQLAESNSAQRDMQVYSGAHSLLQHLSRPSSSVLHLSTYPKPSSLWSIRAGVTDATMFKTMTKHFYLIWLT